MPFDHERLDVYQVALDFLTLADEVSEHLPRGRSHLADQLTRASTSIVLNIAEGSGKVLAARQAPLLSQRQWVSDRVRSHT
jgi:four helix bundle protein